jgi:thiamine-phosphate pyrophosphorylase
MSRPNAKPPQGSAPLGSDRVNSIRSDAGPTPLRSPALRAIRALAQDLAYALQQPWPDANERYFSQKEEKEFKGGTPTSLDDVPSTIAELKEVFSAWPRQAEDGMRLVYVAEGIYHLVQNRGKPEPERMILPMFQESLLPMARACTQPVVSRGLVAVLQDAIDTSLRLRGEALAKRELRSGLYVIFNATPKTTEAAIRRAARNAALGGAQVVQLRCKEENEARIIQLGQSCAEVLRPYSIPVILNDRVDLVERAGAQGVHVGLSDSSVAKCRQTLAPDHIIGASSHTENDQDGILSRSHPTYLALGPIFYSPTKSGHAPLVGMDSLRSACAKSPLPICAIGGIVNPQRMSEIAEAGAFWGAIVSAFETAEDPIWTCCRFSAAFCAAKESPQPSTLRRK